MYAFVSPSQLKMKFYINGKIVGLYINNSTENFYYSNQINSFHEIDTIKIKQGDVLKFKILPKTEKIGVGGALIIDNNIIDITCNNLFIESETGDELSIMSADFSRIKIIGFLIKNFSSSNHLEYTIKYYLPRIIPINYGEKNFIYLNYYFGIFDHVKIQNGNEIIVINNTYNYTINGDKTFTTVNYSAISNMVYEIKEEDLYIITETTNAFVKEYQVYTLKKSNSIQPNITLNVTDTSSNNTNLTINPKDDSGTQNTYIIEKGFFLFLVTPKRGLQCFYNNRKSREIECLDDRCREGYFKISNEISSTDLNNDTCYHCLHGCSICDTSSSCIKCRDNFFLASSPNFRDVCINKYTNKSYTSKPIITINKNCYFSCATCDVKGNETDNECKTCNEGFMKNPFIQSNCYIPCEPHQIFYIDDDYNYKCIDSYSKHSEENENETDVDYLYNGCPEEYPLLVFETNQCVTSCDDEKCLYCKENEMFKYNNRCYFKYSKTTSSSSIINEKALQTNHLSEFHIKNQNNVYFELYTTLDSSSFLFKTKYVVKFALMYNKFLIIYGLTDKGFKGKIKYVYQFYSPSIYLNENKELYNIFINNSITHLNDFENEIELYYDSEFYSYYISQIAITINSSLTKRPFISIYNDKGLKINMLNQNNNNNLNRSVTKKNYYATVNSKFESNTLSDKNIYLIENYVLNGIDITNSNISFFNNPCIYYKENENDISIFDRRTLFFLNYSLCPDDCSLLEINFETYEVKCNCSINVLFNINKYTSNFDNKIKTYQKEYDFDSKFYIFTCYNDLKIIKNFGGLTIFAFIIIISVLIILFYKCEQTSIYKNLIKNIFILNNNNLDFNIKDHNNSMNNNSNASQNNSNSSNSNNIINNFDFDKIRDPIPKDIQTFSLRNDIFEPKINIKMDTILEKNPTAENDTNFNTSFHGRRIFGIKMFLTNRFFDKSSERKMKDDSKDKSKSKKQINRKHNKYHNKQFINNPQERPKMKINKSLSKIIKLKNIFCLYNMMDYETEMFLYFPERAHDYQFDKSYNDSSTIKLSYSEKSEKLPNVLSYVVKILIEKNLILSLIFKLDLYSIFIRVILILFLLCNVIFFNFFLFTPYYISERFKNNIGNKSFGLKIKYILLCEMEKNFIAAVLSFLLYSIFRSFLLAKTTYFDLYLSNEITLGYNLKYFTKFYLKRTAISFSVMEIFLMVYFTFCLFFCNVYPDVQVDVFIGSVICCVVCMAFWICFFVIVGVSKFIGIKYGIK